MPKTFLLCPLGLFYCKLKRSFYLLLFKLGVSAFLIGSDYFSWRILFLTVFLIFYWCFRILSTCSTTFLLRIGRRMSWDSLFFIQGFIILAMPVMSKYLVKMLSVVVLCGCRYFGVDLLCYLTIWWKRCMYMAYECGLSHWDYNLCLLS